MVAFGCDIEYKTQIKVSEIQSLTAKIQAIPAQLSVEVATCKDSSTGLPSEYVLKAQQQVPYIFKDTKYEGCESKGWDTYANFSAEMYMFSHEKGDIYKDKISLLKYQGDRSSSNCVKNYGEQLILTIPKEMVEKFKKVSESDPISVSLRFECAIINDTKKPFFFNATSVYINDYPYPYPMKAVKLEPNEKTTIQLFKGTSEWLMSGAPVVLIHNINEKEIE